MLREHIFQLNINSLVTFSSGTTVKSLLDSPPCSSSSTCYALTTPVVLHSTKGLLTLSSGAFKASDNTYLIKNINNDFSSSLNIALNAIGKNSMSEYYIKKEELYSIISNTNQYRYAIGQDINCSSAIELRYSSMICLNSSMNNYYYKISSNTSVERGIYKESSMGFSFYSIYRYSLIF